MTPSGPREAPLQRLASFLTAKFDMFSKRVLLGNLKIARRNSLLKLGGRLLNPSLGAPALRSRAK
jgi:hypothetical protein